LFSLPTILPSARREKRGERSSNLQDQGEFVRLTLHIRGIYENAIQKLVCERDIFWPLDLEEWMVKICLVMNILLKTNVVLLYRLGIARA